MHTVMVRYEMSSEEGAFIGYVKQRDGYRFYCRSSTDREASFVGSKDAMVQLAAKICSAVETSRRKSVRCGESLWLMSEAPRSFWDSYAAGAIGGKTVLAVARSRLRLGDITGHVLYIAEQPETVSSAVWQMSADLVNERPLSGLTEAPGGFDILDESRDSLAAMGQ